MSRASYLRLVCLVLSLFVLPALVSAQTPPPPGLPAPDGLIAADADQRRFPPLLYPPSPTTPADAPELAAPAAGQAFWQSWSRIAYWGFDGEDYELYTIPPGTGWARQLTDTPTNEAQPTISPDLRRLAFVGNNDGDYDLYLMDYTIDGPAGYVTHLLNTPGHEYWPVWSPDGTRLAFYSFVDGQAEVYTIRADGSQLTRLTNNPGFDGYPTWSPDGMWLAFSSTRSGGYRIYVMNADGSNLRRLSSQSGSLYPTWSPDGVHIAYSADPNNDGWLDIMLMKADGSEQQIFLYSEPLHDRQLRSWSPDNTAIALTEIEYIMFQGEYYIKEAVTAIHTLDHYPSDTIAYSYSFDPSWAKIDLLAPETAVAPLPAESLYLFTVRWSGDDRGPAGLEQYEVQVRADNGAWTDWEVFDSLEWEFAGRGGVTYAFRSRGRDFAGNVEPWPATPDAVTRIESDPPRTTMTPLPAWTRAGQPVTLTWRGYDIGGSGVSSYQAQYRRNDGAWTNVPWSMDTQATLDLPSLGFVSGDRLGVRVRGADEAENVEPWPADPGDTTTILYNRSLSGRVTDNTGTPISGATANLTPSPLAPVSSGPDGDYSAYYTAAAAALTARFARAGYGALPGAAVPLTGDVGLQAVLPPADDVVANGGFEAAGWGAWQVGGSSPPALAAGHTGAGAAFGQPATPFSDRHRLSDTPELPEESATLTLDGAGNAFVLWRVRLEDSNPAAVTYPLYSAVRRADGQWLPTVKLNDNVATYDMGVDGEGRLHLVVGVSQDKIYALHQSGAGWSAAEAVPHSTGASYPLLVARADGRLDVFFQTPQQHLFHLQRAANGAWAAPNDLGQLFMTTGGATLDTDGTLHVLSFRNGHIVHRYLPASGGWSAVEAVATLDGYVEYRVAADSLGGIHLAWLDEANNQIDQLYYRVWRDGQWSAREAPRPALDQSLDFLGWAAGPDGQPQALVGSGQQLIYLRRAVAGWSMPEIRTLSAHYASASMILDASGAAHVAYMDRAENGVYNVFHTMRNASGQWTTSINLSQSAHWGHDGLLATDTLGNVHAIWQFSTEHGAGSSRPADIGYAGPLPGTETGDSRLSQTIAVPADMAHPTLSFLYASAGALKLTVGDAQAVTLPPSPAGLRHTWLPLPAAAGQNVTITFELTQREGLPPMWATLDEVTLGAAHPDVWVTAESSRGVPGGTVHHILRVGNRGAVAGANVVLTYTLPPELTFVSASRPPTSVAPLRWELGALPAGGAPLVIEVTAAARPDLPGRTVSSTAALVATDELELLNNAATAQTPLGSLIFLPSAMRSD